MFVFNDQKCYCIVKVYKKYIIIIEIQSVPRDETKLIVHLLGQRCLSEGVISKTFGVKVYFMYSSEVYVSIVEVNSSHSIAVLLCVV